MPIYEYYCPQHGKFEELKNMEERASHPCPQCKQNCTLIPSRFRHYFFNPFTTDGEGFTSKIVSDRELAEINQETRER